MKLVALSDLHYRMRSDWDPLVEDLAAQVVAGGGDALVVAGDVGCADGVGFRDCLHLFSNFPGERLVVPGNHDLWTQGGDSLALYEEELPRLARDAGFHMLDWGPRVLEDGTAFVGSVGWYDYGYRDPALAVEPGWYEQKCFPGKLLWMDARFIHMELDDPGFTDLLAQRLADHLEAVSGAPRIIAAFHHIPFAELVVRKADPAWTFGNAFMGSPRFGEVLLGHPKVALSISGHSHAAAEATVGHVRAVNLGSTYEKKVAAVLEL